MKIILASLIIYGFFLQSAYGQSGDLAKKVLATINEARTKPDVFLKNKAAEIKKYDEKYAAYLAKAKPISPIEWDPGLEEMARQEVDQNNLNPQYKGKNEQCGISSGSGKGEVSTDPLYYVCYLFSNLHDPDYVYFGIYFGKNNKGFGFQMAKTCDPALVEFKYDQKIDTSKVDFNKLNTAKNTPNLTPVEKMMIAEINFVRAYPKIYAQLIAKNLSDQSAGRFGLRYSEYEAGLELIAELEKMEPLSILTPKECVINAAKKHGADCKKRGFFDHTGSDGSHPWTRVERECKSLTGNENGAGNVGEHPREPVISLLIDSGIPGRGHRYNMLDPKWKYVGCNRYVIETKPTYTFYQWIQKFAVEQ